MPSQMFWPLLLLLTTQCTSGGPLSPAELSALARAEARWKARSFVDYQYEMKQICFCPVESGRWTRITVIQGRVVAAERVEPDSTSSAPNPAYCQPIDSVFSRIRQFAKDPSLQSAYRDIVLEFDPVLGFPTRVEWLSKPNILDAGATYFLRNARPVQ